MKADHIEVRLRFARGCRSAEFSMKDAEIIGASWESGGEVSGLLPLAEEPPNEDFVGFPSYLHVSTDGLILYPKPSSNGLLWLRYKPS